MSGKSFGFGEVLGFGWHVTMDNFLFFVGVFIVLVIISLPLQILQVVEEHYPGIFHPVLGLLLLPLVLIINVILTIGVTKITLNFCDGQKPKFSMLFDGLDCFWTYVAAAVLYSLITMGAVIACVLLPMLLPATTAIPWFAPLTFLAAFILTVVLLIKYSLCFYFVIDKGLGPVDALMASSRTTKGAKWGLFFFGILGSLINFLGAVCFVIGMFVTFPMVMVAMALVYRQLSAQTPGLDEVGIGSPAAPSDVGIRSGLAFRLGHIAQPVLAAQPIPAIQPNPAIQYAFDTQTGPATQPGATDPAVQQEPTKQPAKEKKKSHFFLPAVILGVAVVIAVAYYFWPAAKGAMPSLKHVSLSGILYAEGNPSAIVNGQVVYEQDTIDGVKIIKIHEDKVEFEKAGERWIQEM